MPKVKNVKFCFRCKVNRIKGKGNRLYCPKCIDEIHEIKEEAKRAKRAKYAEKSAKNKLVISEAQLKLMHLNKRLEFCAICGSIEVSIYSNNLCSPCSYKWRQRNKNKTQKYCDPFRKWTSGCYDHLLDCLDKIGSIKPETDDKYTLEDAIEEVCRDANRNKENVVQTIPIALKLGRTGTAQKLIGERIDMNMRGIYNEPTAQYAE